MCHLQVTVGSHMLVDPTAAEAQRADRSAIFVLDSGRRRIAHLAASGHFSAAEFKDALELAEDACEVYDEQLRAAAQAAFGTSGNSSMETA